MIVRLAKIEHRVVQYRVQGFACRFDRRNVAGFERGKHDTRGSVEGRQNRQTKRADQQTERIEPADSRRTEAGGHESGNQHDVFTGLPALVAIRIDTLFAAL